MAALPVGSNLVECNGKSCTHEVAWPPGQEGPLTPPPAHQGPPARTYPFTIDPFQQTAVNALEAGQGWGFGWGKGEVKGDGGCRKGLLWVETPLERVGSVGQ